MGFNTLVVIHNDALGRMEKDASLGEYLGSAIRRNYGVKEPQSFRYGVIISQYHADDLKLALCGWNTGFVVGNAWGDPGHDTAKVQALRSFAASLGYEIRKKSNKER